MTTLIGRPSLHSPLLSSSFSLVFLFYSALFSLSLAASLVVFIFRCISLGRARKDAYSHQDSPAAAVRRVLGAQTHRTPQTRRKAFQAEYSSRDLDNSRRSLRSGHCTGKTSTANAKRKQKDPERERHEGREIFLATFVWKSPRTERQLTFLLSQFLSFPGWPLLRKRDVYGQQNERRLS